jgi:hypothetical protein
MEAAVAGTCFGGAAETGAGVEICGGATVWGGADAAAAGAATGEGAGAETAGEGGAACGIGAPNHAFTPP